jgi:hypothetical protein
LSHFHSTKQINSIPSPYSFLPTHLTNASEEKNKKEGKSQKKEEEEKKKIVEMKEASKKLHRLPIFNLLLYPIK